MINFKKMFSEIEISRDLILLLTIGGLYALSIALSNTLVNVYLWKEWEDVMDLAIYDRYSTIMQPIAVFVAGRWAQKIDRVIVLRLGVVFLSLCFFAVLVFGARASSFLLRLGALLGIGYGFY